MGSFTSAGIAWDAGTNANGLVAAATFALAVVTWRMARATHTMAQATKEEAEHARLATEAAKEAVEAARDQLAEVTRGRVDAAGPVVALMVDASKSAAFVLPPGDGPRSGGTVLLSSITNSSAECELGREFMFPRDESRYLWFRIPCSLHNEGRISVLAEISGEAARSSHGEVSGTPAWNLSTVIPPGESASFVWAGGHTLAEWDAGRVEHDGAANPNRLLRFTVMVQDLRRTVIDYLFAEVGGTPIQAVAGLDGHRQVADLHLSGSVYPTKRWYHHEGGPFPEPPWT